MEPKGKIVKKTTWGRRDEINEPVRLIMAKLDNPNFEKAPYMVSEQVCYKKSTKQCDKEPLEDGFLIGVSWDLTRERAETIFGRDLERIKEFSNTKNIKIFD